MHQEKMAENTVDTELQKQMLLNKAKAVKEIGGVKGPEPTRYNDWEKNGRCVDF